MLIFPVSIVVDLISGFFNVQLHYHIPISQVLRLVIMASILYLLTKRVKPVFIWTVIVPVLFFIVASPFWMITEGMEPGRGYSLGVEIESFSKILYFFIIVTFFIVYRAEIKKHNPLRIISIYGFLIAGAVILSFVTGYGNQTFGSHYGFGTKSYFKAGNDLGLTILYSTVVSSLYMLSHFGWKRALVTLTISMSAILISTRVGILGVFFWLTILIGYIVFVYRPTDSLMYKRLRLLKPVIIVGYTLCVIEVIMFLLSVYDKYMLAKYTSEAMVSARSVLTDPAEDYIGGLEWYEIAFGRGMSSIYHHVAQSVGISAGYRMVEADFHELLGGYGVIGFLVFISPAAYFIIKAFRRYLSQPCITLFAVLFVTASFLAVAYAAGHCFRNTMVAPVYGFMVSLIYYEKGNLTD